MLSVKVDQLSGTGHVASTIEAPLSKLRGIFSVEYDFFLSSLANPAASYDSAR